ncbi:MAG: IS200/IS605 family element transposase accessory protein TnpB [Betaproteobacteria bacterium]|nr:MAG: IS200/IS605 family element transposase accessory protein TnpB [Betaproteobacteria bacterium]
MQTRQQPPQEGAFEGSKTASQDRGHAQHLAASTIGCADQADLIAVEDLKVSNMIRHTTLARSIADASWSRFVSMLEYKAEKAGAHLVRVDPRNTSQKCSGCGELVLKSLAVRTHSCPSCALAIDRDHNASLNILRAGIGAGALNVIGLR